MVRFDCSVVRDDQYCEYRMWGERKKKRCTSEFNVPTLPVPINYNTCNTSQNSAPMIFLWFRLGLFSTNPHNRLNVKQKLKIYIVTM